MQKSEILEPLHDLARELIEIDAAEKSHLIEYTDDDIIAAVLVFGHIIINKKAHLIAREGISVEDGVKEMDRHGEQLHDLVLGMTGVNTKTYYTENDNETH